jgi:hypothetical protein
MINNRAVMKLNQKQKSALKAMRESKGRFFGLTTTQGRVINAKFLGETPNYVTVYDHNNRIDCKLAKTSIASVNSSK